MEINKKIKTKFATIWTDTDGIVHIIFDKRDYLNLNDVQEYLADGLRLSEGQQQPVLVDLRQVNNITNEAGKHLLNDDAKKATKAAAVLTNPLSPILSIGISIFLKLNKEPFPVKFFIREDEAIDWLRDYRF